MRISDKTPASSLDSGSYILFCRLGEPCEIPVGKRGANAFCSGWYAYVGSAMRGLRSRVSRHLRQEKKYHWHIDYFLQKASINSVIVVRSSEKQECRIAGLLHNRYNVIEGFGSSDCSCPGHLFFHPDEMTGDVMRILQKTGMVPELLTAETE